jgi:hypothetical protein
MKREEEKYLARIVGLKKVAELSKSAQGIVLENSMWENMIDGALKALETVALLSLDWKLMGIVKLLQSWLEDQREAARAKQMQNQYGWGHEETSTGTSYDEWGGTTY